MTHTILDPLTNFNNQLCMNTIQRKMFVKNNTYFQNSFYENDLCKSTSKQDLVYDFSFVKKSFVYVITETVADYPHVYFSEKTWKAILFKSPFMIVGAKDSLRKLQEFGFKTFSEFWDESYDQYTHAADRIDQIIKNLLVLKKLSKEDIDKMYKSMLPIIEYNQLHLKEFYKLQLTQIENLT
jgi:hypothetical protein